MPTGLAVAAIAGVGFVAHLGGLPTAFWLLAALMGLVTLSASIVTRGVTKAR